MFSILQSKISHSLFNVSVVVFSFAFKLRLVRLFMLCFSRNVYVETPFWRRDRKCFDNSKKGLEEAEELIYMYFSSTLTIMEVECMAQFFELIRSFENIRDYMRDFYIYGFKQRGDFDRRSARTYDNQKRRIESYMSKYIRWTYDKNGKRTFISLDSSRIPENPLYAAWKSKSFTANDIMLHFYIMDALRDGLLMTVDEIIAHVCAQSGQIFDTQTVRIKCKEYVREGIFCCKKNGKAFVYSLSDDILPSDMVNAVKFYQGTVPFGEIGSFIMDNLGQKNDLFRFKHNYIVHTLEDGVLMKILRAMRKKQYIYFENHSARSGMGSVVAGVPIKIFCSTVTGRRYVCVYNTFRRRFMNYRLDYVKTVEPGEVYEHYDEAVEALKQNIGFVWGVSFGGKSRKEILCMKLYIDEQKEDYIYRRLCREGRGGEVLRLSENVFLYTKETFDTSEMSPWIKTFMGRIISLEGTNREVVNKFYRDMRRMQAMYCAEE